MRRLLFLCLLAGCTSGEQYMAAGSSFRIDGGMTHDNADGSFRTGKEFDSGSDGWYLGGSIQPFAYWFMKQQAEANAHAMVEAQYLAEMARREKDKPK